MQILETHMRQKLLLITWRENPVRKGYKTIETLTNSTTKIEFNQQRYKILKSEFILTTELNNLEREVLLSLTNPKLKEIKDKFNHLGGIQMQIVTLYAVLPHSCLRSFLLANLQEGELCQVYTNTYSYFSKHLEFSQ